MKFATLPNGTEDGALIVVSRYLTRAAPATDIAPSLLAALRDWPRAAPLLQALAARVEDGTAPGLMPFDTAAVLAPLPRAPQWLDGSAFLNHARLIEQAFNTPPDPRCRNRPAGLSGRQRRPVGRAG